MLLEFHHFLDGLVEFRKYYTGKGKGKEIDEFAFSMLSSTLDDLSPMLKSDLKLFYKQNAFYPSVFGSEKIIGQYPDYPALRTYLKSVSSEDFMDLVISESPVGIVEEDASIDEKMKSLEEGYRAMGDGESVMQSYKEMKRYPEEMMERFITFLDRMYEGYFAPREEHIRKELSVILAKHRQLQEEHPDAFMRELIKVDFSDMYGTKDLDYRFYLGYLNTGRIAYSPRPESVLCFYNYIFERHFDPAFDSAIKARLFKSLSDETRIEIIKIIAREETYAADLAEKLNLTKATMSYHLNMLSGQNILNIRIGENKRIYYSLNVKQLGDYFEAFVSDISGSSER